MGNGKLINITCTWRHCTLEYLIKKFDASQDMSRTAVFEREVKAAKDFEDWNSILPLLSPPKLVKIEEAPVFTNLQAKYSEETEEILNKVRNQMLYDLKKTGLKVLQSQYMVLLLQANYLESLKKEKLSINQENIDIPEMAKIFCEMMLTDKDCDELQKIQVILINWRNK